LKVLYQKVEVFAQGGTPFRQPFRRTGSPPKNGPPGALGSACSDSWRRVFMATWIMSQRSRF